jgi:hypothetical protein
MTIDALTRIPLKAQLYARETYYREGWASLVDGLGADAVEVLRTTALLMVKADGIAAGKVGIVVRFLRDNGFEIVAVETPPLAGFVWRELWRFQLTCATMDRLAVNELVMRDRGLLLLLRDTRPDDIPSSVRLGILKGTADPATQSATCLRRLLGQPNRVLSYIHVADEPADVARELGILITAEQRRRVVAALRNTTTGQEDARRLEEISAMSAATSRSFDPQRALDRVEAVLRMAGDPTVTDTISRMRRGERISWRPFAAALETTGITFDPWDLATLGTSFIVYDEPGTSKQIVGVEPGRWRQPS